MNVGKTLFAQVVDYVPWKTFGRIVERHSGDAGVRTLIYATDATGLELDATIYALDSTTIDLCLSLFDWAPFRATKAAVKMHTLLDMRGAVPAFIHISDGKMGDVNILDLLIVEAGSFYVVDRGYMDFKRLYKLHQAGAFFVTRAKRGMDARRVYSAQTDRTTGVICDQSIALNGFYTAKGEGS